jgi:hypothetical protein
VEAKAGHLRLPGACCLLPGPGTSQAREVQGCVSWQRWREGSLLSARGSPWQQHILGGFCGFLRQPVLLGTLQVQVIWVGKPSLGGGLTQWVGVVFAYVPMHVRTPETWPVEAPEKVSAHSPTGLGDTAHILRSFVGAG